MESQAEAPKLLDEARNVLRLHYYSIHTERSLENINMPLLTEFERRVGGRFYIHATPTELIRSIRLA
jgi:hypothetical protein